MKYEQIMDKIEVTPEMRQRVLRNVEAEQAKQKKRQLTRRLVTLAACLAIVVCCWYVWKPKQTDPPEQGMMAVAQIDTVDSLEALTEKTGIPMNELTGVPFTVERTEYVSYWDELAEIQYFGGSDSLCYRKSPGTEDNSGDCNGVRAGGNTGNLRKRRDLKGRQRRVQSGHLDGRKLRLLHFRDGPAFPGCVWGAA